MLLWKVISTMEKIKQSKEIEKPGVTGRAAVLNMGVREEVIEKVTSERRLEEVGHEGF